MINNTYTVKQNSLIKLLNDIDEFESMIEVFKQNHKQYEYSVKIEKINEEDGWIASINIRTKNGNNSCKAI